MVSAIKSFSIVDQNKQVVFKLNAEQQTYSFYNTTLQKEIETGIPILPLARSSFENRSIIRDPNTDQTVSLTLFAKAVREYCHTELKKDGFTLLERA